MGWIQVITNYERRITNKSQITNYVAEYRIPNTEYRKPNAEHRKPNTMQPNWDERYSTPEYIYGKEPNLLFKAFIDSHNPGRVYLPGEGEGRNAVYAARKGWIVDAADQSPNAREKAMKLAAERSQKTTIPPRRRAKWLAGMLGL